VSRAARQGLLALDGDGVLVDYHEGYARAWERAFGTRPRVRDPLGYHPLAYWDVPHLSEEGLRHFHDHGLNEEGWASFPAMPGAAQACELLRDAGYDLVCVTALQAQYKAARETNLRELGMGISAVHAVGAPGLGNPKTAILRQLQPQAFVDDCLPFLQRVPRSIWRALIEGRPHGSPNRDPRCVPPNARYASLLEFAEAWVARPPR